MSTISAATVTLAGVDYDPLALQLSADNQWSPTFKADCTLARDGMVQNVAAAVNLFTNPSASVDLTDVVPGSATVARQTAIKVFATAHGTAFRIAPTAAAAQITIGGDYGGLRLGMQAGKTYTLSATFYVDAALTGTVNAQARQLAIGCIAPSLNGGSSFYLALSPQAANVAGTSTRVSVTFTLPADATSAVVRAFVGHAAGTAYWTDFLLVEGNGTDPDGSTMQFFDGDSPWNALYRYSWSGAAGKSSSTRSKAANNALGPVVDPRLYPYARLRWWYGDDAAAGGVPVMYDVSLLVRTYALDDVAGTVQLTLLSDEIRLQDITNVDTADWQPGAMTLVDMVRFCMRRMGNPAVDLTTLPAVTVPAAATIWRAGDTLDNWIQGAMRASGLELYYDAFSATWRAWALGVNPGKSGTAADVGALLPSLFFGGGLLSAAVGVDADSPDFGDAVTMIYTWTDTANVSQRKVYASTPNGAYRKGITKTFTTPDPGTDPAPSTRVLATRAGYTAAAEILPGRSTYADGTGNTRPIHLGDYGLLGLSDGTIYQGYVANATWSYPADKMKLGFTGVSFSGSFAPA